MPKRSSTRLDVNQMAYAVMMASVGEDEPEVTEEPEESAADSKKNPAAVALGKLGGPKGGKARAEKLSPEQRKAIAEKAAKARWEKTEKGGKRFNNG